MSLYISLPEGAAAEALTTQLHLARAAVWLRGCLEACCSGARHRTARGSSLVSKMQQWGFSKGYHLPIMGLLVVSKSFKHFWFEATRYRVREGARYATFEPRHVRPSAVRPWHHSAQENTFDILSYLGHLFWDDPSDFWICGMGWKISGFRREIWDLTSSGLGFDTRGMSKMALVMGTPIDGILVDHQVWRSHVTTSWFPIVCSRPNADASRNNQAWSWNILTSFIPLLEAQWLSASRATKPFWTTSNGHFTHCFNPIRNLYEWPSTHRTNAALEFRNLLPFAANGSYWGSRKQCKRFWRFLVSKALSTGERFHHAAAMVETIKLFGWVWGPSWSIFSAPEASAELGDVVVFSNLPMSPGVAKMPGWMAMGLKRLWLKQETIHQITIFISGISTIPSHGWFMAWRFPALDGRHSVDAKAFDWSLCL